MVLRSALFERVFQEVAFFSWQDFVLRFLKLPDTLEAVLEVTSKRLARLQYLVKVAILLSLCLYFEFNHIAIFHNIFFSFRA